MVLLTVLSAFSIYSFSDQLLDVSEDITSYLPFRRPPYIPLNVTGMEAIEYLSRSVARIDRRVSVLSEDLTSVRADVDNLPSPTTVIESAPAAPVRATPTPKTNFLTTGLGLGVDHRMTSPTVGEPATYLGRTWDRCKGVLNRVRGQKRMSQPPLAALAPWENVGDCWCSVPHDGMWQLSLELGLPVVPEEVVVEHHPASINPSVAPREMELWAQFVVVPVSPETTANSTKKSRSSWGFPLRSNDEETRDEKARVPLEDFSLSDHVMNTVRLANRGAPDEEFSDDKLLGPSFYRISRWTYDVHDTQYAQEFSLDAIIDEPAIRVNHVVFRVKSNWGSEDATCLYRVKLHGHV